MPRYRQRSGWRASGGSGIRGGAGRIVTALSDSRASTWGALSASGRASAQPGIGRCGTLLAEELYSVRAGIVALGKGLGGGMPLAVLLARGNACCFESGGLVGSCHGNSLATTAGLAVLDTVLEPGFLEHVRAAGEQLWGGWHNWPTGRVTVRCAAMACRWSACRHRRCWRRR
ncbi:aminotransferase class III-fold pyridoxal phosphate-dependent enzyme [Azotobacter armeniacus]